MQFFHTNRFCGAGDFASYVIDAFDWLHREGAHAPKMMSIGLLADNRATWSHRCP
jgi:allantoinase